MRSVSNGQNSGIACDNTFFNGGVCCPTFWLKLLFVMLTDPPEQLVLLDRPAGVGAVGLNVSFGKKANGTWSNNVGAEDEITASAPRIKIDVAFNVERNP